MAFLRLVSALVSCCFIFTFSTVSSKTLIPETRLGSTRIHVNLRQFDLFIMFNPMILKVHSPRELVVTV
jgi:hypothetical protein